MFIDADEEYGSLGAVQRRLEAWLSNQPEAYRSAYAIESAPAIFAPFVRNELLGWEPVFEETKGERFAANGDPSIQRLLKKSKFGKRHHHMIDSTNFLVKGIWNKMC